MIQVYTGCGKGKTTAAIGLAVRASGYGKKIFIAQFMKGKYYGEISSLKKIKDITLIQCGGRCFIKSGPKPKDIDIAQAAVKKVARLSREGKYDVIIMDEINVALHMGLVKINQVLEIMALTPAKTELVLTGRYCPKEIINKADLVSEIKEIKHYYRHGVKARKGIEY